MAAKKYHQTSSDGTSTEEKAFTVVSAGAANDGDGVALDATGKLDTSVLPTNVGPEVKVLVASENLSAGDYVNIWNDTGTIKVRKADASTLAKKADGFVLAAVTSGNNATVYLDGINDQLSSLTGGTVYFLSDQTPGATTATAPTTAAHIVQELGKALSATEIRWHASKPIVRA